MNFVAEPNLVTADPDHLCDYYVSALVLDCNTSMSNSDIV